ncbi:universal stress protein [Streptomyces sp. NPDC101152]|uniref:universal stress protein n=1 Tax=Streptomyces sp. NPDC101152 TaxID=3366116 RepID=UPI00380515AB
MPRTITAALNGSPESLTAAAWAAREALLRDLPLHLVHAVGKPPYAPLGGAPRPSLSPAQQISRADEVLREAEAVILRQYPGLRITTDRLAEEPVPALLGAAGEADLVVLGSRGRGGVAGFLVGSVAQEVVGGSRGPVVLVRGGLHPEDERQPGAFGSGAAPFRDVVLGLNSAAPNDTVIEFACEAASQRGARLRVVHGRSPDLPYDDPGGDVSAVLEPWRHKFPRVEVTEQAVIGKPDSHLVEASRDASLVVVGRRRRPTTIGAVIGPVAHVVLHHATAPVAVVPHG